MSLEDWLPKPGAITTPFFGIERDPRIEFNGLTIRPDIFVPEFERRTWRERLFEKPFTPFKKFRDIRLVYIVNNKIAFCSRSTFNLLKDATTKKP